MKIAPPASLNNRGTKQFTHSKSYLFLRSRVHQFYALWLCKLVMMSSLTHNKAYHCCFVTYALLHMHSVMPLEDSVGVGPCKPNRYVVTYLSYVRNGLKERFKRNIKVESR